MKLTKPLDKKSLRKAFWASLGRLIGVVMGAGGGSLLYQTIGSSTSLAIGIACGLVVISFIMMWVTEYEKEMS